MTNLKEKLAVGAWECLVRLGSSRHRIAIYGFGCGGRWNERLAGRIMCSSWWPSGEVS